MKLKNKLLLGSLTAVLLAVMSFSAWKIWVIRSEYHAGEAAYEDISHMISLPQKTAEPQPPVINKPAGAETLPDEDDTIWPEVDFPVLREINPDIVAWIYIEGTKINYEPEVMDRCPCECLQILRRRHPNHPVRQPENRCAETRERRGCSQQIVSGSGAADKAYHHLQGAKAAV